MSISTTLEHIDSWLARHAPATHRSLRAGATADRSTLTISTEQDLHDDVVALWGWHDGADGRPHAFQLAPQFDFLQINSAIHFRRQWSDQARQDPFTLWRSTWLPIGSDGCGNLMVVDHSSGHLYGNVFLISPHAGNLVYDLAVSPADLVTSLRDALDHGTLFDGHRAHLDNGALEWVPDQQAPSATYNRPYNT